MLDAIVISLERVFRMSFHIKSQIGCPPRETVDAGQGQLTSGRNRIDRFDLHPQHAILVKRLSKHALNTIVTEDGTLLQLIPYLFISSHLALILNMATIRRGDQLVPLRGLP